jgi:hypothetical protein
MVDYFLPCYGLSALISFHPALPNNFSAHGYFCIIWTFLPPSNRLAASDLVVLDGK